MTSMVTVVPNPMALRRGSPAVDPVASDPLLSEVAKTLRAHFGDRLVRLVLHGSRARGDHRSDSDYDIVAFLSGDVDRLAEQEGLHGHEDQWWWRHDAAVDVKVLPADAEDGWTLFMHFLRRDGISL